ncbi:MAG: AAA family ATPase, partial [Candidatus Altiarchaeales archaeon]|nr:AAA family ATPase [Candidatus Altiarchaeales archaeon]
PTYVPEDFSHRDSQIRELTYSLKPGLRGVNPLNVLLHGPPATGKTTAVKFLFRKVRETSGKLIPVYVNCEDSSTPYAIFSRIYEEIYGVSPPSTGKPLGYLKERIFHKLKRDDKSLAVALDEVDRLFLNKTVDEVLISLLKAHSTYGYGRVGVVGVMLRDDRLTLLDEKTRSVFNPARIYFKPYSRGEIRDILSKRVEYGFYGEVVSTDVLSKVVDLTLKGGDLRLGIDLLRRSAMIAEGEASKIMEENHVEEAFSKIKTKEIPEKLSEEKIMLLKTVKEAEDKTSGKIYNEFNRKTGIGIKKYNKLIKELEYEGILESEYKKGRGRSRVLRIKTALNL